jgi:hypothetical protein
MTARHGGWKMGTEVFPDVQEDEEWLKKEEAKSGYDKSMVGKDHVWWRIRIGIEMEGACEIWKMSLDEVTRNRAG